MKKIFASFFIFFAAILSFAQKGSSNDCIVFDGVYQGPAERTSGGFYYMPDGVVYRIPQRFAEAFNEKAPNPVLAASQSILVYQVYFSENPGIFVADLKTGGDIRVSNAGQEECRVLAVSPSHKKILYVCKVDAKILICTVNTDGTGYRESFQFKGTDSTWAVDARFVNENEIVYWTGSPLKIYRGNLVTQTNSMLFEYNGNSSFSADNLNAAKILLSSDKDQKSYVLDLTQQKVTVSNYLSFMKYQCLWLENGSSVLYIVTGDESKNRQEFRVYNTGTGEDTEIVSLDAAYCGLMGTAANGTQCLFSSVNRETYEGTIYSFDVGTKAIRNLSAEYSVFTSGGRACPFLSVAAAGGFIKAGEVLEYMGRKELERTEKKPLTLEILQNGIVKIRIEELRYETTYLDSIAIRAGDKLYLPQNCQPMLASIDGNYLILKKGESIELEFRIPGAAAMVLETTGYYVPLYR